MDMRIPPLKLKILLESNPLKSRILVQRLTVPEMEWEGREGGRSGAALLVLGAADAPELPDTLGGKLRGPDDRAGPCQALPDTGGGTQQALPVKRRGGLRRRPSASWNLQKNAGVPFVAVPGCFLLRFASGRRTAATRLTYGNLRWRRGRDKHNRDARKGTPAALQNLHPVGWPDPAAPLRADPHFGSSAALPSDCGSGCCHLTESTAEQLGMERC